MNIGHSTDPKPLTPHEIDLQCSMGNVDMFLPERWLATLAERDRELAAKSEECNKLRADILDLCLANEEKNTRLTRELAEARKALDPFARLARLNAPLNLPDDLPMSKFIPGVWPVMADCRRAALAAEGGGE